MGQWGDEGKWSEVKRDVDGLQGRKMGRAREEGIQGRGGRKESREGGGGESREIGGEQREERTEWNSCTRDGSCVNKQLTIQPLIP